MFERAVLTISRTLIGNLRALQDFTIMNTRLLAGTIPTGSFRILRNSTHVLAEIGLINDLVTLQWSNANLTGPIPTQLYKFNLSTIELSGNSLTGTLPTEFAINMKVSTCLRATAHNPFLAWSQRLSRQSHPKQQSVDDHHVPHGVCCVAEHVDSVRNYSAWVVR